MGWAESGSSQASWLGPSQSENNQYHSLHKGQLPRMHVHIITELNVIDIYMKYQEIALW